MFTSQHTVVHGSALDRNRIGRRDIDVINQDIYVDEVLSLECKVEVVKLFLKRNE